MKRSVQFSRFAVLVLLCLTLCTSVCFGAGQQPTPGVPTSRTITINGTANEISSSTGAQSLAANRTWTLSLPSSLNFSSKSLLLPSSTTLPGTCTIGQIYFDTDATAGQNVYGCTATNTWTLQGGSGSGNVTNTGTPTSGQAAEWTSATIIQGVAVTGTGSYAKATNPTLTLRDSLVTFQDDADATKQAQFQLSGITSGTVRTYTLPDLSDTLVTLTATQTLTGKTLTQPTITDFTNATHNHTTNALGGQITDAALSAAVTVAKGGTGRTTLTNHGVLVGAGTTAITQLGAATAGTVLAGQGAASDPSFTATPTFGVAGTTLGTVALTGNTSGTITIQPQAAAGTYNFNLPTAAGTSGQPLLSGGGGAAAMTFGTLGVAGGGTGAATFTTNGVLYGNGTSAFNVTAQGAANSILTANAGAPAFSQTPTINTSLTLGVGSSQTGSLVYKNVTNNNTFTFQPGATASNLTFTLPTTDSTGTQCLSSNGSGILSWSACSAGSGTPGGSTTQVQYNNAGSFGGSTGMTLTGTTITSTANRITTASATATLGTSDGPIVACTGGASDITLTLPAGATTTQRYWGIIKVDSGVGKCLVKGNGTETINGSTGTASAATQWSRVDLDLQSTSGTPNWSAVFGKTAIDLTADVTGILPVANGGTGIGTLTGLLIGNGTSAVTATTTSAGIAGQISDETGSGALVFGTSPTIVTPTIASFTNATHNHTNAAGGGQLTDAALSAAVTVAKGGTGQTTLTNHGLLVGAGTTAITQLASATNGQLPIGSTGADPVLAALTGTANQITVTNGAGSITLSIPSSPTLPGTTTGTFSGSLTGNASTATALAANGANCSVTGTFPNGVDASGVSENCVALSGILPKTATYSVVVGDFDTYKTITVASGTFTLTLPAAASQPTAGKYIKVVNYGSGVVTIARVDTNINGGTASLTLPAASATAPTAATIESDGTNYFADSQVAPAVTTLASLSSANGTAIPASSTLVVAGVDINTSNQVTATHLASALPVNQGGTGALTFATNGVLFGNGTGAVGVTAQGATGTVLHGNAGVPTFTAVSLTADVTGVLPAANLPTTTVNSVVNDTNVTGSISAQALTLGWTGTLAKARIIGTAVYNDQANTWSTGAQDMGAATSLKIPVSAGATTATNGFVAYDSTNNMLHAAQSGADAKVPQFTITPLDSECVKWVVSGSQYKLGSAGAACGSGSSGTAGSPLFTQTATTTVTATSETTMLGSGAGSLTIPANWFTAAGNSLQVQWYGRLTTTAVPGTQRIRLKFGTNVILDTGAYSLVGSLTNVVGRIITTITARTVGASGTLMAESVFETTGAALVPNEAKMLNTATITVDTTATQVVDLTNLFDTASNSVSTEVFTMYGLGSAVSSVNGKSGAVVLGLASADFANQGNTTTVLHGNAAGNPSFSAVSLTADVTGILPGANGGTGNGFFAVSGPATSLKTFTFPNASATVLTDNAAVTVAQGGTGAATFTTNGVLFGNGTSAVGVTAQGAAGTVLHGNAGVPTFTSVVNADIATATIDLTTKVTGTLPVASGGTGTASTLTGLVRGSGTAMTAAEISGDCTTSGSNAITCTKLNGTTFTGVSGNLVSFATTTTPGDSGLSVQYAKATAALTAQANVGGM